MTVIVMDRSPIHPPPIFDPLFLLPKVSIEAESLASESTGCVIGDYEAYSLINLKSSAKKWMTANTLNKYSKACGHDTAFRLHH